MPAVAIGLGIASLATSIGGGVLANKSAKKAAKDQARLTKFQRDEEIRKQKITNERTRAEARAAVYASGLIYGGSSKKYINQMNWEQMREEGYAARAAEMERQAIKAGARGAGGALFAQAAGDALGIAATAYASGAFNSAPTATVSSSHLANMPSTNPVGP